MIVTIRYDGRYHDVIRFECDVEDADEMIAYETGRRGWEHENWSATIEFDGEEL